VDAQRKNYEKIKDKKFAITFFEKGLMVTSSELLMSLLTALEIFEPIASDCVAE
jgi:hypothetical protein